MARLFLLSFVLVVAAVEACHAVSPLEAYWFSVLPNTTMPNAIRNLIDPAMKDDKNRVKVREGMTQHVFILSGALPSAEYVRSTFFPIKDMYPGAQMNQGLNFDQTIIGVSPIKKIPYHSKLVVCHQEPSPQAVHYCHTNIAYEGYVVPLIGKDGSKVNAVAVCHHDTINFNRFFLELLNVEPGVEPVCHFLPINHLVWVSSEAMRKAVNICSDCVA
ncbi:BURP domain-containing protein 3 [Carex littledalei]|uniref:BURP domain-containing protein 3 n=1 Tax=Carex littledalei TaxID=544730 RepID=A0A833V204_9POAL|nr:BURP domain-containing protein 3 [Carex littledalei]